MNSPRLVRLLDVDDVPVKVKKSKLNPVANRARLSARMKAMWADPAFAEKIRAAATRTCEALNRDPDFCAKRLARLNEYHADPDVKARLRDHMRKLNADPVFAEKNRRAASSRMKALNEDPEFKARMIARLRNRSR